MKYLCLVYLDENRRHEVSDEDCLAYDAAVKKSGHCIVSEALESVHTATTLRIRKEKFSIVDGPFAETKEQLAGFYLIEAQDLNEAIRIASAIPGVHIGCIEVRPVRPIEEMVARVETPRSPKS